MVRETAIRFVGRAEGATRVGVGFGRVRDFRFGALAILSFYARPVYTKSVKLLEVYRAFLHPTKIGRSLRDCLRATLDPSVYAKDLLPLFEGNPALASSILKWDSLQGKLGEWIAEDAVKAPAASAGAGMAGKNATNGILPGADTADERKLLLRALNLLGKSAVRNLVASREILRIGDALPRKAGEKLKINPKEQIPYALSAEEKSEATPGVLPEVAFLVGYHFDLLRAALLRAKAPREAIQTLEREWPDFLKDAQFSVRLAATLRDFEEGGLVFSGSLLSQIGSIIMRAVHPGDLGDKSYREFAKINLTVERADERRWLGEREAFPILEREWALLLIREVGLFPELERLVRYVEDPWFFLEGRDLVLSDLVHEGLLNRRARRGRRRMILSEEMFETLRKKST